MAFLWGVVAAGIARWRGCSGAIALLLGALVLSHWVLDYVTHTPDLPLWPGSSPRVGLGLWQSVPATLVVEGLLYLVGIAMYLKATRPRDGVGIFGFWALIILCAGMWASGPAVAPPPSPRAVAWFTLGLWLFIAWAGWADRHRVIRSTA